MKAGTRRRVMDRKIVERLLLGDGVNQICRTVGVSKRRVMAVRARADEAGYLDGTVSLPPYPEAIFPDVSDGRSAKRSPAWELLDLHRDWIRERLAAGWHGVTVYEELPVRVPRSSFYRYLFRHGLQTLGVGLRRRVVPEIVHMPGEAVLVDWGYLWTVDEGGARRKLWAFIAVLGYSRFMTVELMTSCDMAQTLDAMRRVFDRFGGVPRRTTSDNPKVFSLEANRYEPILNPAYERFASYYGTLIECLPPQAPEKKGKVERPISYIRRLFESYAGDRSDLVALQAHIDRKVEMANSRCHGTTRERPVDRFLTEERQALLALPPVAYEPEEYHEGRVRTDGHVRFSGKYYSLPEDYIGKEVSVIGSRERVAIYYRGKLVETHERVTCRNQSKSTKPHHRKPWEQECDNPDGLTAAARKVGPGAEAFVTTILRSGDGFIDYRKIWGVLSLVKKYTADEVDQACERAIEEDSYSYRTVKLHCEALRAETTVVSPVTTTTTLPRAPGTFARDLSTYQQLVLTLTKGGTTYEQ